MTLGEKLSKLRKEQNYTQEQLGELLGVSRQSISKWESDVAYPETDKLIRMGKLFDCSMDYLLKEEVEEKDACAKNTVPVFDKLYSVVKRQCRERKSEKMIFGMPLYHIGKDARGFFAIGFKARGVFAMGLLARGIVTIGLLSIGVLPMGLLSLGVLSLGTLSFGAVSVGAIAFGLLSIGAISVGVVSLGALSVGCFARGALAVGRYIAIGDRASAMIAIGKTAANATVEGVVGGADWNHICALLNLHTPSWLTWAKELFELFM